MKRTLLCMSAASVLALAGLGCKTVDEKRADYHSWRAERAADKGNDETAREQEQKAQKARASLRTDPLPLP
jgi:sRNA-binding protein